MVLGAGTGDPSNRDCECECECEWEMVDSCLGETVEALRNVADRGECSIEAGGGLPWRGGTDSGEGLFFAVRFKDRAGFNGTGGGFLDWATLDVVETVLDMSLERVIPPPNFASASCTDERRMFDPKVGVPHLELARSVTSRSLLYLSS